MMDPENEPVTLNRPEDFLGEKPFCDLVMKGGITSGVVYPRAAIELARRYRLKNIGGTSAGAIAAALTAAAEYARQRGGFTRLGETSDSIATLLPSLFQPAPRLRPLFQSLTAASEARGGTSKLAAAAVQLALGYWPATLAGCLPAACLAGLVTWRWNHPIGWLAVALAAMLGIAVVLCWRITRALNVELPANGFGVCRGLSEPRRAGQPALTEWLAAELDRVAGLDQAADRPAGRPLTFGDLRGEEADQPRINLQMMATNLTEGRPYRLPLDERNVFMYRPEEFRSLFPSRIVDWMDARSKEVGGQPGFRWLPRTADLPVIVAVRMSLSFPLLISAVPLYSRDFSRGDDESRAVPRRQWFSDGGISSNFPIHLFDDIWPRWPTFGIKLVPHRPEIHGERRVAMPRKAASGQLLELRDIESLGQFLGAIADAMQEWRDNLQCVLPGYRERIVQVRLASDEGGMNLNMPPDRVRQLAGYGSQAGRELRDAFDWDAHRWRRFLVSVARLDGLLDELATACSEATPQIEELRAFLDRYGGDPAEYVQTKAWVQACREDIEELLACHRAWSERTRIGDGRIPRPAVDIRFAPRV